MGVSIADDNKEYLTWEEIQPHLENVRKLAVQQLETIWRKYMAIDNFLPLWGDEIEYIMVSLDHANKRATLSPKQHRVLEKWKQHRKRNPSRGFQVDPEAMAYMVEMSANPPFGPGISRILEVEKNLVRRRETLQAFLSRDELAVTMPVFPRLGATRSINIPNDPSSDTPAHTNVDSMMSRYGRYKCLADNTTSRRGREMEAKMPLFQDTNTGVDTKSVAGRDKVALDSYGYAFGASAIQVTMQAKNLDEACRLHDQLSIIGPLMMAMSAATPGFKGLLADTDVRWDIIRSIIDARNADEALRMDQLGSDVVVAKGRTNASPIYISGSNDVKDSYQSYLPAPSEIQEKLEAIDMSDNLACHFAHFLQFDPIVLESNHVEPHSAEDTYHFRTLYRTTWPHVRLKIPEDENNGWRIEFRPMDVQITDFENTACICFVVLLRHTLEYYKPNLYVPMDLVVKNMQTAIKRDAVLHEKFWFRTGGCFPKDSPWRCPNDGAAFETQNGAQHGASKGTRSNADIQQMSLKDIFCGPSHGCWCKDHSNASFPGLVPLVKGFLETLSISKDEKTALMKYVDFMGKRASGRLWTGARWMRHIIRSHPSYKNDSIVTEEACYDLCCKIRDIYQGKMTVPELF